MAYSLTERLRIKVEILWENTMDRLAEYDRKPLIFFAAVAVFFTLRSSQRGVGLVKPSMMANTRSLVNPALRGGAASPYGQTSSLYGTHTSQYGAASSSGASHASPYGGQTSQFGQTGAAAGASSYGAQTSPYGAQHSSAFGAHTPGQPAAAAAAAAAGSFGQTTSQFGAQTNSYGQTPQFGQNHAGPAHQTNSFAQPPPPPASPYGQTPPAAAAGTMGQTNPYGQTSHTHYGQTGGAYGQTNTYGQTSSFGNTHHPPGAAGGAAMATQTSPYGQSSSAAAPYASQTSPYGSSSPYGSTSPYGQTSRSPSNGGGGLLSKLGFGKSSKPTYATTATSSSPAYLNRANGGIHNPEKVKTLLLFGGGFLFLFFVFAYVTAE